MVEKSAGSKSKPFTVDMNPIILWVAVIYGITRGLEYLNLIGLHFWTRLWNKIVDMCDDEYYFKVYFTTAYSLAIFTFVGGLFIIMDVTNKPAFFRKYKTQPEANAPLDMNKFWPSARRVYFNLIVLNIIISHFATTIESKFERAGLREIPSFTTLMIHLFIFHQLIYEFCFFYVHWILHSKFFYKRVHKIHHEWSAPVSIMAVYSHWFEHVCCNIMPLIIGVALLNAPMSTTWVMTATASINALCDHSGYHLPFMRSPQFHDYHHLKFNECFGENGLFDALHGTSKNFLNSIQFMRHRTFFTLKAPSEIYPEDEKKND